MSQSDFDQIRANLAAVHEQIATACDRAGRDPGEVRLVAVTKYARDEWVEALLTLNQHALGENRPQQLIQRAQQFAAASTPVEWHLIGQLQRNKVRAVLPHVALIHSVDSWRLLEQIERVAVEESRDVNVLLQVNVSGEASKSGFCQAEIEDQWEAVQQTTRTKVCGLMTMAPLTTDESIVRSTFSGLRALRDRLQERSPEIALTELSMGMSEDFPIALAEGATLVRVGSRLFAGCG